MAQKSPEFIQEYYGDFVIQSEDSRLDTEPEVGSGSKDLVITRALDGFMMLRDGEYVYPTWEVSTAEWWKGVEVYGYISAVSGDFRFFVWAGQWEEDFDEKHIEVVRIRQVVGMCKEASNHWRNGAEEILWLESEAGFSYALLVPAEDYDRGRWVNVTDSWKSLPNDLSQADPRFTPVSREGPKPSWWKGEAGARAWKHFQKPLKEAQRAEKETKRKQIAAERKRIRGLRKSLEAVGKQMAKGKSKAVAKDLREPSTTSSGAEPAGAESSSTGSKRKREDAKYDSGRLRKRKSEISYMEIDETEGEGEEEEPASEQPTKRSRPSPSKAKRPIVIKSPKKLREVILSSDDEEPSSPAPNVESQSNPGKPAGAGLACSDEHPASSQPARAMRDLSIDDPSGESSFRMEGVTEAAEAIPVESDVAPSTDEGSAPCLPTVSQLAESDATSEAAAHPNPPALRVGSSPARAPAPLAPRSASAPPVAIPVPILASTLTLPDTSPVAVVPPPGASPPRAELTKAPESAASVDAPTPAPTPAPALGPAPSSAPPPAPAAASIIRPRSPALTANPGVASDAPPAPIPLPDPVGLAASALVVPAAPGSASAAGSTPVRGPSDDATAAVSPPSAAPVSSTVSMVPVAAPRPVLPPVEAVGEFELDNMTGRRSKLGRQ